MHNGHKTKDKRLSDEEEIIDQDFEFDDQQKSAHDKEKKIEKLTLKIDESYDFKEEEDDAELAYHNNLTPLPWDRKVSSYLSGRRSRTLSTPSTPVSPYFFGYLSLRNSNPCFSDRILATDDITKIEAHIMPVEMRSRFRILMSYLVLGIIGLMSYFVFPEAASLIISSEVVLAIGIHSSQSLNRLKTLGGFTAFIESALTAAFTPLKLEMNTFGYFVMFASFITNWYVYQSAAPRLLEQIAKFWPTFKQNISKYILKNILLTTIALVATMMLTAGSYVGLMKLAKGTIFTTSYNLSFLLSIGGVAIFAFMFRGLRKVPLLVKELFKATGNPDEDYTKGRRSFLTEFLFSLEYDDDGNCIDSLGKMIGKIAYSVCISFGLGTLIAVYGQWGLVNTMIDDIPELLPFISSDLILNIVLYISFMARVLLITVAVMEIMELIKNKWIPSLSNTPNRLVSDVSESPIISSSSQRNEQQASLSLGTKLKIYLDDTGEQIKYNFKTSFFSADNPIWREQFGDDWKTFYDQYCMLAFEGDDGINDTYRIKWYQYPQALLETSFDFCLNILCWPLSGVNAGLNGLLAGSGDSTSSQLTSGISNTSSSAAISTRSIASKNKERKQDFLHSRQSLPTLPIIAENSLSSDELKPSTPLIRSKSANYLIEDYESKGSLIKDSESKGSLIEDSQPKGSLLEDSQPKDSPSAFQQVSKKGFFSDMRKGFKAVVEDVTSKNESSSPLTTPLLGSGDREEV